MSLPLPVAQSETRRKTTFDIGSGSPSRGFRVRWARIKRRIGTSSLDAPSETLDDLADGSRPSDTFEPFDSGSKSWNNVGGSQTEPDEVDIVVVDNVFADDITPNMPSGSRTNRTHSEKGAQDVASISHPHTDNLSTTTISLWDRYVFLTVVRWRIMPFLFRFNSQAFLDPVAEKQYQRETWWASLLFMPLFMSLTPDSIQGSRTRHSLSLGLFGWL